MTDQEYVESKWEDAHLLGPVDSVCVRLPTYFTLICGNADEAWSAARAFTEERLEEIRQVERELDLISEEKTEAWIEVQLCDHVEKYPAFTNRLCRWSRILARTEAHLESLKRGMRP